VCETESRTTQRKIHIAALYTLSVLVRIFLYYRPLWTVSWWPESCSNIIAIIHLQMSHRKTNYEWKMWQGE